MNIKHMLRTLVNFLVPTPATVRRHRAPSARFVTLEAVAASRGDSLKRHGRNYNLVTSDLRVLEFDNLAQVKSFLTEPIGLPEGDIRCDGGPYPGDSNYVERPRNIFLPSNLDMGKKPVAIIFNSEAVTKDIVRE